jgi:RNA polymerase nonessential primary-like sigma factor
MTTNGCPSKEAPARSRRHRRAVARDEWQLAGGEVADPAQVNEWIKAYRETNKVEFRDKVINAHMRLVAYFARTMASPEVPFDDLMAEGVIRLMRCILLFEIDRGVPFSTYAAVVLRTNMRRSVARTSQLVRIPDAAAKGRKDRAAREREFYLKNGRKPTLEELPPAENEHVSETALPAWAPDAEPGEMPDERFCPVGAASSTDTAAALTRAISKLPANTKELICKRFGILGERRHSVLELSASMGKTRQAVSEAISRACGVLKEELSADEIRLLQRA